MAIQVRSDDYGSSLYRSEDGHPLFDKLERDDRVRSTYDRNDWSTGDYVYAEDDCTLYLTGSGAPLWTWDGRDLY
jgi:hypothetical protein